MSAPRANSLSEFWAKTDEFNFFHRAGGPFAAAEGTYKLVTVQALKRAATPAMEPCPDGELVTAALAGESWACEALFRRHADRVNGFAYRLLGRDDELDDVVQESFATALGQLHKLNDPQAFSSWLFSIVATTVRRTLRKRRLLDRLGLRKTVPLEAESLVAESAPAEVAAELKMVLGLLEGMPTDLRIVLVLRRVEGMRLQEIADVLGISLRTVKRRVARAEAVVRSEMGLAGEAPENDFDSSRPASDQSEALGGGSRSTNETHGVAHVE